MGNRTSDKNVGNIEKDIKNIKQYINLVLDKGYCDCNELNVISTGKYCDGSKNVAYSMQNVLADYTRQKEINEEHQKINGELRERIQELGEENRMLKNNKVLVSRYFKLKDNSIPKQKIKDIVNECIPKKENIITYEIEYTPNTNYLTEQILELLQ